MVNLCSMELVRVRPVENVPSDLGAPVLPGSKSHAQRAMLLATGTRRGVTIRGITRADDTAALATALESLGSHLDWSGSDLLVRGSLFGANGDVFLQENGTALRFLTVIVPMLRGQLRLDGAPGLRRRPLNAALDLLASAGIQASSRKLPLEVDGSTARWPKELMVDSRRSTQAASGALIGLALRVRAGEPGAVLRVKKPSAPGYLELTVRVLQHFGHAVKWRHAGDDLAIEVGSNATMAPLEYRVPPDPSASAFPLALAAMHERRWKPHWDPDEVHPDLAVVQDFARLRAAAPEQTLSFSQLASRPDCFPALCVAAAMRVGETRFTEIPALRIKESDRLQAMASALTQLGVPCEELPDGLVLRGPIPTSEEPVTLDAPADHRVVMALALLGTVLPAGVVIPHPEATNKSWPGFFEWLQRVARVEHHDA